MLEINWCENHCIPEGSIHQVSKKADVIEEQTENKMKVLASEWRKKMMKMTEKCVQVTHKVPYN